MKKIILFVLLLSSCGINNEKIDDEIIDKQITDQTKNPVSYSKIFLHSQVQFNWDIFILDKSNPENIDTNQKIFVYNWKRGTIVVEKFLQDKKTSLNNFDDIDDFYQHNKLLMLKYKDLMKIEIIYDEKVGLYAYEQLLTTSKSYSILYWYHDWKDFYLIQFKSKDLIIDKEIMGELKWELGRLFIKQ